MNNKKLPEEYLQELINIALENNAKLVSKEWVGSSQNYEFELANGRTMLISHNNLTRRGWPKDLRTNEDKLNELKLIAKENGGELISKEWLGFRKEHEFEYDDGRRFFITSESIKKNGWPINYIGELEKSAKINKCILLENEWKGSQVKYEFELFDGRKFFMLPYQMKNNFPKNVDSIFKSDNDYLNELKEIAENNGGKLKSDKWLGAKKKYKFEYQDGTIFERTASGIKNDGWPKNIHLFLNLSKSQYKTENDFLNEMNSIAIERNGRLLSKEWLGNTAKYKFVDENNIEFECTHSALLKGQWTPERGLVSEPICRQVLNHMFGVQFEKTKKILTAKLLNRTHALELDGFNEKLKIAFEYQGHPSHWDKNHKAYQQTYERDLLKKKYCKDLNIILIEIPCFIQNSKKWEAETVFYWILEKVIEAYSNSGKKVPKLNIENFKIDFNKINHSTEMYQKLKEIAKSNQGELLSKEWRGNNAKYLFKHSDGREFISTASRIMHKGWIKDLDKILKDNEDYLENLKKFAKENGGELLSDEWVGSSAKYEFKYNDGTIFQRSANSILTKGWPVTNTFLKTDEDRINKLQEIAEENGGKLLSDKWNGNTFKYKFSFEDGRIFERSAAEILQGNWPQNADQYFKHHESYKLRGLKRKMK